MSKFRGLERRTEGATPTGTEVFCKTLLYIYFVSPIFDTIDTYVTRQGSHKFSSILAEGGMTLYIKAGPDGTSVGDW